MKTVLFGVVLLLLGHHHASAWTQYGVATKLPPTTKLRATPVEILQSCKVLSAVDGSLRPVLTKPNIFTSMIEPDYRLVVVLPQLGEFDSTEYVELLNAVLPDLKAAKVELSVVGIGSFASARRFAAFTGLPLEVLSVDPSAELARRLGCHRGPNWDVPAWVSDSMCEWFAGKVGASSDPRLVVRAWLNYMAMCAGVSAPGTLPEILRGYTGDRTAPERLRSTEVVTAGPVSITGTTDVKLGSIEYQNFWKNEQGYQRPVELATVRLRNMVEVLSNFDGYVDDQTLLDWRGATFVVDKNGAVRYEYRSRGVLTYSDTMSRPLSFLSSFIGDKIARNPLGFTDPLDSRP